VAVIKIGSYFADFIALYEYIEMFFYPAIAKIDKK